MSRQAKKSSRIQSSGIIEDIAGCISSGMPAISCTGTLNAQRAYIISLLCQRLGRPIFIVVSSMAEAENFVQDLEFFSGSDAPGICLFPPYNILPFKKVSYHNETAANRIRVLYHMSAGSDEAKIVAAPVETLLQRIIPLGELTRYSELVMVNEDIDRQSLIEKLNAGGYVQAAMVEEPGDYSVRGEIVDIFSPMYENPLRIEFFGDTVDGIRLFSASSQRKLEYLEEAVILPAKEAILYKHRLHEIIERARTQRLAEQLPRSAEDEFAEKISNEGIFPGIESLLPLIYESLDTVFDYIPEKTLIITQDMGDMEKAALEKQDLVERNYISARRDQRMCVAPEQIYQQWSVAKESICKRQQVCFRELEIHSPGRKIAAESASFKLEADDLSDLEASLSGQRKDEQILKPLAQWITKHVTGGYTTMMVCRNKSQAKRLLDLVDAYGINPRIVSGFSDMIPFSPEPGICMGRLSSGFVWHDQRLAVITDRQIFGTRVRQRRRKQVRQEVQTAFLDFADLNSGDLVVHVDHGIGRYHGLEKITVEGVTNDFLVLEYRGGDKLFVPVDRMDVVQKYMGIDDSDPLVDKLGGTSWARVKDRAKKSVEKIAGDLLDLYAQRKVKKGYAFGVSDSYYKDFEAGFPFEETEDQLRAIEDVIADMESSVPMDRLICGDVGYGKTEVALRAAFKSVNDGKQVAVLVPTTLLSEQHFRTFSERFKRYPVNIESLNRFRSKKEQAKIINGLKQGSVDVVIGTHRLLQKDVAFKDLGLIIVDEEQRFGVRHKEKLKKMRTTVDVLSMTATPIPRTLHMSLLGVRDISVITTPPELRQPIISYISEFDSEVIAEAIRSEMARGGQIFFIHNNINTIRNMSGKLSEIIPEVRLGVAHGRLAEDELEQVMYKFINREIDMLVSTTIVESGLDIPNANTMIINRADRMGLAQLYQLRGRVGRADTQAYAYLIVPREAALSRDAQKRLKVVMEHSDLGAGFQIALNDLKIRGGGAALGVSQSGHIAAVGYDMFLKLMEEAVSRLKGEPVAEPLEPEINIPVSVFIPESYIKDIDQRLSAYRRLARMTELKEVADLREELTDRYGKPPAEAIHLLLKIMLKILATKAGVRRLDLNWDTMSLCFSEMHQKNPYGILDLIRSNPDLYRFSPDQVLYVRMGKNHINSLMNQAKKILLEITTHVNN
jgi:transcription-repair coupling factor (superfamily II helicase)